MVNIAMVFYTMAAKPDNKPSLKKVIFNCIQVVLFVFAIPALFLWLLCKNRDRLLLKKNKDRFGSLYVGVRIKQMSEIFCVFEFMAFRLWFVVLTFTMMPYPGIVCNIYMFLNNLNIIYIGWFHPYDSSQ